MSQRASESTASGNACANCAAPLTGRYCATCGQADKNIMRPFLSLITDLADGLFDWHGRFFSTVRDLYRRPGRLARDYVDGRRAAYTPPIRLYLVVSLVFFAAIGASGIRVLSIDSDASSAPASCDNGITPASADIDMFVRRPTPEPIFLSEEQRDCFVGIDAIDGGAIDALFANILVTALENPAELEAASARGAAQALLVMVAAFAFLNALLHPRRRVIEHIVHTLYFHSAMLAPLVVYIVAANQLAGTTFLKASFAAVGLGAFAIALAFFERGFYQSSLAGTVLRTAPMFIGYMIALTVTTFGLIALTFL